MRGVDSEMEAAAVIDCCLSIVRPASDPSGTLLPPTAPQKGRVSPAKKAVSLDDQRHSLVDLDFLNREDCRHSHRAIS